jgi:hypothetical protein
MVRVALASVFLLFALRSSKLHTSEATAEGIRAIQLSILVSGIFRCRFANQQQAEESNQSVYYD